LPIGSASNQKIFEPTLYGFRWEHCCFRWMLYSHHKTGIACCWLRVLHQLPKAEYSPVGSANLQAARRSWHKIHDGVSSLPTGQFAYSASQIFIVLPILMQLISRKNSNSAGKPSGRCITPTCCPCTAASIGPCRCSICCRPHFPHPAVCSVTGTLWESCRCGSCGPLLWHSRSDCSLL
jgi:hypothetical protein